MLEKAAIAITKNWKDNTELLEILESRSKGDEYSFRIRILAKIFEDQPKDLSILRELIKPKVQGIFPAIYRRFSTVRTFIKDDDVKTLKLALQDLKIPVKVNHYVRGGRSRDRSKGEFAEVKADIVAVLEGGCD